MWVCEDQDGVVWAGLLSGIVRLKDDQTRLISRKDGLFDNNIYSIVPDDLGNLWVDSGRGFFRVSRQNLNDFADGKTNRVECTVFDGINSVKVSDTTVQERVGCKTADGRIWFPNPLGVVMIDPAYIPVNRVAPPAHIDRIRANGKEVSRGADAVVPPGRGELEINYQAPSFIAPQQMQFRYRLEGYDRGWVEAGGRRMAFYTNLKPGRYTFRVMAANADGVWNETGDAVRIELRPYFFQTNWFYLLCGLAAFATLLGGYLWRIRRLESKQRALQQSRDRLETEVRQRTAELTHEQQRLQFIFESMPVGVAFARQHPDGRIERIINEAHLRICGLTREQDQIPGIYLKITHPEDAARQAELGRELNDGRNGHLTMEKRFVRLDGRTVWVAFSFQRQHNADGSIEELTTVMDITERKLAETKLVETSALLATLLENTTDAIYFKDLQSRFVHFSREMLKNFHLTQPGELTGKTDFDVYSEDHARPAFETEQTIIRTGQPVLNLEEKETHHDGRVSWALTSKMPWRDDAGNIIGTMGISRDITERKRMESQFFQAQKMETVGKLAGGVAHEFNSILTAIICQAELLRADLPPHSPMAKDAEEILKAAHRAAELTRQLLAYGRRQMLQPKILDLNQVLTDMDGVLRQLMGGKTVEVNMVLAASLPLVKADAGQIEQVIINLALNARDAMPQGGKLTVETANVTLDQDSTSFYPELKPGSYVMLAITDNGTGMSEEVKARAFEPFFTTKDVGQGSGLGLSTCYGIIKQSGGHINVYSERNLGTTFRIYLPQAEPVTTAKLPAQRQALPALPRGTETILMVEDDPALGKMTAGLLRQLGYTVLTAANGMEAMGLVRQPDTGHIDLLFTDVVMPLMNGKELASQMRALFPRLRILFTSGYTENASIHQGVMDAKVPFLPKPFTPASLAHKLREVLGRPAA
jgi:PAS domain S-box-containing protein